MKKIILALILIFLFAINSYAANYALEFDGVNDYVSFPDSDDWTYGTGNFTMDLWTYWDVNTGGRYFFSQFNDNNNRTSFYYNSTNISFYYNVGGSWKASYIYDWIPTIGIWYHIALVRNGTELLLFIDGDKKTWTTIGIAISNNNLGDISGPMRIGCYKGLGVAKYFFDGYMDEVRIWDVARTEQEIQYWKDWELYGSQPDLVAYWNFNEGSGQVLGDLSGNGHNGTIYGAQWVSGAPVGVIPEPTTMLLMFFGLLGACLFRKRTRR